MGEHSNKEEYNILPVYYCRDCYSLRVMRYEMDSNDMCYCGECNSTDIGRTDIYRYLRLKRERDSIYNKKHSIGDLKYGIKSKSNKR